MSQSTTIPWSTVNGTPTTRETSPEAPLASGIEAVVATTAEIESLRGVTNAAADLSECACPESCERDHANE